ncbi:MAG: glycosyltransferase [Muribaculaceae bacterium]
MNNLIFDWHISADVWLLLGLGMLCLLWAVFAYGGMARRVARAVQRDTADAGADPQNDVDAENSGDRRPTNCGLPVSVVVRSFNDGETLARLLPDLLGQEYAPGFEVIVVNEGSSDETTAIVESLSGTFDNLYLTFTPDDGLNVSSKKLAVTLGVKAARNPIVVLLDADAVMPSSKWLSRMTLPFLDGSVDVVLGYSSPNLLHDEGLGRRHRAFNQAEESVAWISEALGGRPYRGSESNLAFRRKVFFDNKGFSRSLNLREGVDDIFVNEITDGSNTAVELARQTHILRDCCDLRAQIRAARKSHAFTSRFVPHRGSVMLNVGALSVLAAVVLFAVASVLAWPNLVVAIASAVLVLFMLVYDIVWWRRAIRALSGPRMMLTLPWLMLTSPVRSLIFNVRCRMGHNRNYTYSR